MYTRVRGREGRFTTVKTVQKGNGMYRSRYVKGRIEYKTENLLPQNVHKSLREFQTSIGPDFEPAYPDIKGQVDPTFYVG